MKRIQNTSCTQLHGCTRFSLMQIRNLLLPQNWRNKSRPLSIVAYGCINNAKSRSNCSVSLTWSCSNAGMATADQNKAIFFGRPLWKAPKFYYCESQELSYLTCFALHVVVDVTPMMVM